MIIIIIIIIIIAIIVIILIRRKIKIIVIIIIRIIIVIIIVIPIITIITTVIIIATIIIRGWVTNAEIETIRRKIEKEGRGEVNEGVIQESDNTADINYEHVDINHADSSFQLQINY